MCLILEKTSELLRNLLWNEFLRSRRKSLDFLEHRAKEFEHLANDLGAARCITGKMANILDEEIMTAKDYLLEVEKESHVGVRLTPLVHYEFRSMLDYIESAHSDFMVMLLQILFEKIRCDPIASINDHTVSEAMRLLRIPPQTNAAVLKIMENCTAALYGNSGSIAESLEPVVVHWLYHYYRFLPSSRTISMPSSDSSNLCHFSYLAHESVHSKLFDITTTLGNLSVAEKIGDSAQAEKYKLIMNQLLPDSYQKVTETFKHLEKRFVAILKDRLGEIYKSIYRNVIKDEFVVPARFLEYQFCEFICDFGSVKIAGPANVVLSACMFADSLRNPSLDTMRHLYSLNHPPDSIRVASQKFALQRGNLYNEMIDQIDVLVEGLSRADCAGGLINDGERQEVDFLDRYFNILMEKGECGKSLIDEMLELSDRIVREDHCYNKNRWAKVMKYYPIAGERDEKEYLNLHPYDFVNVVWLKLFEISKKPMTYGEYVDSYSSVKPFLNMVWKKLVGCQFSRACGV